jgi:hypothetical protein
MNEAEAMKQLERKTPFEQEQRYKLSKEDYYELRTRIRDVEAVELDALKATREFEKLHHEALQRRNTTFDEMTQRYDLDPKATYRWDDKTCELILQEKS